MCTISPWKKMSTKTNLTDVLYLEYQALQECWIIILRRTMHGCYKDTKEKAFIALVRPQYCAPVWSPYQRKYIDRCPRKCWSRREHQDGCVLQSGTEIASCGQIIQWLWAWAWLANPCTEKRCTQLLSNTQNGESFWSFGFWGLPVL